MTYFSCVKALSNRYEGAAIFERILKCATKHASAGNASEERDSGKSSSSLGKEFSKTLLKKKASPVARQGP
jgi:hypothetical protein